MAKDPASLLIDTNPSQAPGFFLALGYALAGWQFVEGGLFKIFLKVSTCQNETIAAGIFYAIEDFAKKVEMTRCAIRLLLPDKSPLYTDWQKLRKALIDQSEIRNALAHFHVGIHATVGQSFELQYQFLSSAGDLVGPPSAAKQKDNHVATMLLHPNSLDPNEKFRETNRKKTKKPMTSKDLLAARDGFNSLADALKTFSGKIPLPAKQPKE